MMKKLLFPRYADGNIFSIFLLALRVLIGGLFLLHGLDKLLNFAVYSGDFPDPLGIGSVASMILVIFAELFCSIAFILGFFYRLLMIPMIISMFVAFFWIHQADIAQGELAFLYLIIFITMFIAGPGRFSLDYILLKTFQNEER